MRPPKRVLTARQVLLLSLFTLLVALQYIGCEQLSTVFVLETSDSDSSAVSNVSNNGESSAMKNADLSASNTRIITDQTEAHNNNNNNKRNQSNNSQRSSNASNTQSSSSSNNNKQTHDQIQNDEATNSSGSRNRDNATRRLEEENLYKSSLANNNNSPKQQSQSQQGRNKQQTSTSSYQDHDHEHNSSQVPKTEERLLISITSEDDDSYLGGGGGGGHLHKPPKVSSSLSGGSTGGGYNDQQDQLSGGHNQQVHQHQKRKPAITISIQDASGGLNKQNGGSGGGSAVILRPGEDGQSIVIATVGTGGGSGGYKPSIISSGSGLSENTNKPTHHITSNNNDPYREPINNNNNNNNPMQGIIQQHQRPVQTTRRPSALVPVNDPYREPINSNLGNGNSRPLVSTLVDGHRPSSQQVTDERPHRPTHEVDTLSPSSQYDTTSRPPLRPMHNQYDTNRPTLINEPTNNYGGGGGNTELGGLGQSSSRQYPLNEKNCGIMHETRIVGGEEADPDDFMWMAAIIKSKPGAGEPRPFCGGSLITRRHILTAAHCLEGLAPRDVLVRLGSYDFEDSASSSSADYAIDQFRVPAQYSKKTHVADIAIMRLKTPLSTNDNYKTVCMPQPRRSYVGALGTVTGYGSQSQTFRRAAPKLRQVTVPIWENRKCSVVYKKNLTESFMCAGYEEGGKDACQGDSGGPLMTEGPEQRMMIVGVVSHGIGCGSPGYPGVYTRTSTFQEWIEKNTSE